MNILEHMKEIAVVPVVVLENADDAVNTAEALLNGGIDVMEITLRTDAALESINRVAKQCSDMIVGAGTVVNRTQCEAAIKAGAKFIVSPGFSKDVVAYCQSNNIPVLPGCVTPSEIMAAMEMGLNVVKFFPANIYGGISAMKALAAPFHQISFVPTGGVNGENIGEYLSQPFIHAVGGSWLCTKKDIKEGNFENISKLCQQAIHNKPKN